MRTCKRCGETKFGFSMYKKDMGLFVQGFDICKKCANEIQYTAVLDYLEGKH